MVLIYHLGGNMLRAMVLLSTTLVLSSTCNANALYTLETQAGTDCWNILSTMSLVETADSVYRCIEKNLGKISRHDCLEISNAIRIVSDNVYDAQERKPSWNDESTEAAKGIAIQIDDKLCTKIW